MGTDGIDALLGKREELPAQIQGAKSAIFHIDQTLALIGYSKSVKARRFSNDELLKPAGEAERAGHQTAMRIAQCIVAAKGLDGGMRSCGRGSSSA
jgi:hypothetical protein